MIKAGTTSQIITIIICMPSGTWTFQASKVDEDHFVELKVYRPGPMVDAQWMYWKFFMRRENLRLNHISRNGAKLPNKNSFFRSGVK